MKFGADYENQIQYHPKKANVIADTISQRKAMVSLRKDLQQLSEEFKRIWGKTHPSTTGCISSQYVSLYPRSLIKDTFLECLSCGYKPTNGMCDNS